MSEKEKTVFEGEREIPVYTECDLLVVGGGAAGHSAAVAAARAGCKNIVLMERYGYMGGDVTGGYVIMVPRLSFYNKQYVRGLQEEWFTRMESIPVLFLDPPAMRSVVRIRSLSMHGRTFTIALVPMRSCPNDWFDLYTLSQTS